MAGTLTAGGGGIPSMQQVVDDLRGPASIDAALESLSPNDQTLLAMGIDPFGGDQGMMQGQPAVNPSMATAVSLAEIQKGFVPQTESEMVAAAKIQEAINALGGM